MRQLEVMSTKDYSKELSKLVECNIASFIKPSYLTEDDIKFGQLWTLDKLSKARFMEPKGLVLGVDYEKIYSEIDKFTKLCFKNTMTLLLIDLSLEDIKDIIVQYGKEEYLSFRSTFGKSSICRLPECKMEALCVIIRFAHENSICPTTLAI